MIKVLQYSSFRSYSAIAFLLKIKKYADLFSSS